jgi:hypothetical protein
MGDGEGATVCVLSCSFAVRLLVLLSEQAIVNSAHLTKISAREANAVQVSGG